MIQAAFTDNQINYLHKRRLRPKNNPDCIYIHLNIDCSRALFIIIKAAQLALLQLIPFSWSQEHPHNALFS